MTVRRALLAAAVLSAVGAVAAATPAAASYLVARDVGKITLRVDAGGHALVSYTDRGKARHVLVWGGVNALPPKAGGRQVAFKVDYSGGWKALKKPNYYRTIRNVCSRARYDGPKLPYLVYACKATDGSYWAIQRWQRMLPNLGFDPWRPQQAAQELHLSHWKGPLPPIVSVEVPSPGPWDPADSAKVSTEDTVNALVESLGFTPRQCHH